MKVVLVNPRFPLSLWDFTLCRDIGGSAFPFPPLSLATLAGLTPAGHDVVIVDENVRPLDLNVDADIVGITGYLIQQERVFELARHFRKRGITVAIGGPLVRRENLAECMQHAEAVFLGEAEYTWPAFLRDRAAGAVRSPYVQETLVDLADSPLPRFDLVDWPSYSSAVIETSRGCPHSCEFCEVPVRLGKGSRTKSVDQVMAEVRSLAALGADSIFIIDDNLFGSRQRALSLLEEIARFVEENGRRIYFSCQFTIDIARDEAVLDLLERANMRRVFIGIETPRQDALAAAKKGQNTRMDLQEAVRAIQKHNIIVWGAFIVGFDSDDREVFREQFDFITAAAIPVAMVGLLQAIPGTPLYERIGREGRFRGGGAGGIRVAADRLVQSNIEPKNMTYGELVEGYRRLARRLYEYEHFSDRLLRAVAQGKGGGPVGSPRFTLSSMRSLLRLLRYYFLTTDLQRTRMFLRVVLQTLRRAPGHLQTVLLHLVVFKHLKQFYEEGTAEQM